MTISWHIDEGLDAIERYRAEWERLFDAVKAEPSTSYEWTSALAHTSVAPGNRVFLITLRRRGSLVGIVPLLHRTRRRVAGASGTLMPLAEEYSTHSDLLLASADSDTAGALIDACLELGASWDTFRMSRLLQMSAWPDRLREAFAARGHFPKIWPGVAAYFLELPETFDAYLAGRSHKFRNHLRRVERKLAGAGELAVCEASRPEDLAAGYEALLQVESGSWKHRDGTSIAAVGAQNAFYRRLCEGALARGRLHLHWLTLDGRPLAYNLGYLGAFGYHYLKTSYVEDCRQLGAATVLRARLVEALIARGVRRFDFPGEPYDWEAQWATTLRRRVVFSAHRRTARGCVLAVADLLRQRGRTRTAQGRDTLFPRAKSM